MHLRLMLGFVLRLPSLLVRRMRGRPPFARARPQRPRQIIAPLIEMIWPVM